MMDDMDFDQAAYNEQANSIYKKMGDPPLYHKQNEELGHSYSYRFQRWYARL